MLPIHQTRIHARDADPTMHPPSKENGCLDSICATSQHLTILSSCGGHFTTSSIGVPFSLMRKTRNFAGSVLLAFRPIVWTSSGDS